MFEYYSLASPTTVAASAKRSERFPQDLHSKVAMPSGSGAHASCSDKAVTDMITQIDKSGLNIHFVFLSHHVHSALSLKVLSMRRI